MTSRPPESAKCFSEATCRELIAFVSRLGSLSPCAMLPSDVRTCLDRLCQTDAAFAGWMSGSCEASTLSGEKSTSDFLPGDNTVSHGVNSGERDLDAGAVLAISKRLVSESQWFDGECPTARALRDVAALVVRLQTMEREFAAELLRQKTEALYHIAYGLSHELNNPLANIATRAGVLARDESQPARQDLLVAIVDNAMRGSEMLGDLMLIARPPKFVPEATSAKHFAQALAEQAAAWTRGRDVYLSTHLDSNSQVRIDASAMQEATWCLIRNAIEAMPDGGEVTLTVRDDQPARCVRIEIADRGCGLSPQAQAHCFDPYFSGREAGRGLGMGLAKARRIVELHAGRLNLYNRPGGGCQAVIELPLLG